MEDADVYTAWQAVQTVASYKLRKRSQTVVKIVEECYLRDDISCGIPACGACAPGPRPLGGAEATHYCVVAADALAAWSELLELGDVADLVLPASAVKQVLSGASQRAANRVRALCRDARRRVHVLPDAHAAAVAALAASASLPPPLAVAAFYATHLAPPPPHGIVVLSDALAPLFDATLPGGRAPPDGVQVLPAASYFPRFYASSPAVLELHDSLAAAARAAAEAAAEADADGAAVLSDAALEAGLASGELVRGVLQVSRGVPDEATVRGEGSAGALVLLPSRSACGRALHGDTVAVRVLPRAAWRAPRSARTAEEAQPDMLACGGDGGGGADGGAAGEAAAAEPPDGDGVGAAPPGAMRTGVVAGVLTRAAHELVACLAADDERALTERFAATGADAEAAAGAASAARERLLCVPMDRRLPLVRVYTRHAGRLLGRRFVLRLDTWARGSAFPEGHVVRVLGRLGDLDTEREALLAQHRVPIEPFCAAALAELPTDTPEQRWAPPPDELARRRDLRAARTASIDPPGCTDVDDALSVEPRPDGTPGWRVGVHIADVAHFVAAGGPLDAEAAARGTTVYLVDRRYDMLPAVLSENLCSLLAGRERLAVSVQWDLESDGSLAPGRAPWAGRTVIRSAHQLTYGDAQAILDGTPPPTPAFASLPAAEAAALRRDLRVLDAFSSRLRAQREADGALELASAEVRFALGDDGRPRTAVAKAPLPVMAMVAELMIAANAAVAERIAAAFPNAALLRRHAPPRVEGLRELAALAASGGLAAGDGALAAAASAAGAGAALPDGGRAVLTAALAAAEAQADDPAAAELLKVTATRAMSEAEYVCTGATATSAATSSDAGVAHFGLALRHYTHFTSPIRRYADVAVHRQLHAALAAGERPPCAPAVAALAEHLNARHRAAKAVQKACSELYFMLLLQDEQRVERAVVAALRPDGLQLFVPRFHVRASARLADAEGTVLPPTVSDDDAGAAAAADGAEDLSLDASTPGVLRMLRAGSGEVACEWRVLQRVWVELRAGGSRAHGLALRARLLDERHPAVVAARAAAAQDAAAAALRAVAGGAAIGGAVAPPPQQQQQSLLQDASAPAAPGTPAAQPRAARAEAPPPPLTLAEVIDRMHDMQLESSSHTAPALTVAQPSLDIAALRCAAAQLEAAAGGARVRADATRPGEQRAAWEARASAARAAADNAWAALRRAEQAGSS